MIDPFYILATLILVGRFNATHVHYMSNTFILKRDKRARNSIGRFTKKPNYKLRGALFTVVFVSLIGGFIHLQPQEEPTQVSGEYFLNPSNVNFSPQEEPKALTEEQKERIFRENMQIEHEMRKTPSQLKAEYKKEIEKKITHYFPRSHKTILAIAKAESNMRMDAINYNCYYNEDKTIVYTQRVKGSHSTHCKKGHEGFAWSVDCFVLQRNYLGQQCPEDVSLDEHLEDCANLSRVQGLRAWVTYNNGDYIKHLATK